jgi:hypothetical protein
MLHDPAAVGVGRKTLAGKRRGHQTDRTRGVDALIHLRAQASGHVELGRPDEELGDQRLVGQKVGAQVAQHGGPRQRLGSVFADSNSQQVPRPLPHRFVSGFASGHCPFSFTPSF